MTIRKRPAIFDVMNAPPGVEINFHPRWKERPLASFRGMLIHTNGAQGIGSIESARNWTLADWGTNAMPHYQADLGGRACKFLPSNRKGICNFNADWFFLSVETADFGWGPGDPGTDAEYTPQQVETISHIIAYESIVHKFPIVTPLTWDGIGVASHTDPFAFPNWTKHPGKPCPGLAKKRQMRTVLHPLAQIIVSTWMNPDVVPISDEEDLMDYVILPRGNWWPSNYDGGSGPAWFIRFKSGKLIRCTAPDFKRALITPGIGTEYCENKEHYNELLEQCGTTLVPKI